MEEGLGEQEARQAASATLSALTPVIQKYRKFMILDQATGDRIINQAARGAKTNEDINASIQSSLINLLKQKNPNLAIVLRLDLDIRQNNLNPPEESVVRAAFVTDAFRIGSYASAQRAIEDIREARPRIRHDAAHPIDPLQMLREAQLAQADQIDAQRTRIRGPAAAAFRKYVAFTRSAELIAAVPNAVQAVEKTATSPITRIYEKDAFENARKSREQAMAGLSGEGREAVTRATDSFVAYERADHELGMTLREYREAVQGGNMSAEKRLAEVLPAKMRAVELAYGKLKTDSMIAAKYDNELTNIIKEDVVFIYTKSVMAGLGGTIENISEGASERVLGSSAEHVVVRAGGVTITRGEVASKVTEKVIERTVEKPVEKAIKKVSGEGEEN